MENEVKRDFLNYVKQIDLMELLPKAMSVKQKDFRITPSEFITEMCFTTGERFKKLAHIANSKKLLPEYANYPPQFKVIPHILWFQNFEPRNAYSVVLEIRNIGKSLLTLKMYCPPSEYFAAERDGTSIKKLAPGLSDTYEVTFTPKEGKDYAHYLEFQSNGDTFQVPIVAIGPRPLLDIPDKIVLNCAPVKTSISKYIFVRNLGNISAIFTFITESDRFEVTPPKGVLLPHDTQLLKISFKSSKVEEVTENLTVVLETGEKLFVTLQGSSENVSIRLDKNSVVHEDTFVGLKRCKSVRIYNNSSSVVKFSWEKNKTYEEDQAFISSMKEKFKELSELEVVKDNKVVYYGLCDALNHKLSCERILKDETQLIEKEGIHFNDNAFNIIPLKGEVWPKSYTEVIVAFEPKVCGTVTAEAYLEVSGRDTRLPLKLKATGLGPKISFNVSTLDIDYIYLCSQHRYEVIAINKGDVPGTVEHKVENFVFGGKAEVIPKSRTLQRGECGTFVISFTSNRQGEFIERINFIIKESDQEIGFNIKGKIVSPTLHFGIRQLDFGIIPVGFPFDREVNLNNLSMVPVTFSLRVLSDGETPSLSYKNFSMFSMQPFLPSSPKEFRIEPEESVVEPFSSKKVKITLTANRVGRFLSYLVLDMWDSESGSVSCPVHYFSQVATITADPEMITIPFCFINFPYTRSIMLRNISKIAGFYYILPTNPTTHTAITCSANISQGVLEAKSCIKVDITLMTTSLGRQVLPVTVMVFGNPSPREVCTISCVGQGPVVTIFPLNLAWGDVPLLLEDKKTIVLCNESPIPATLSISLSKPSSSWSVSPSHFTLDPEESTEVTVVLVLSDRGKHKDNLKINVHNGKMTYVPLSAVGVGSSLKITPNISPKCDLGSLFSNKRYDFEIKIENKGTKSYSLVWSPYREFKHFVNLKLMNPPELIFRMEPPKVDVLPGETKFITLQVQKNDIGYSQQRFFCFANIGVLTKELHIICDVMAEFVEPLITFDKAEVNYWWNMGFDSPDQKLEDTVTIINNSVLPVYINISVRHPFYIEHEEKTDSTEMYLEGNESKSITVKFVVQGNETRTSHIFKKNLTVSFKEHSKKLTVALKGEINYPNVVVIPKAIDFGYVPLGINAYQELLLVNTCPFTIRYHISWNIIASSLKKRQQKEENQDKTTSDRRVEEKSESRASESTETYVGEEEEEETTIREEVKVPIKPVPTMPKIVVSNQDIRTALYPLSHCFSKNNEELINAYRTAQSNEKEPVPEFMSLCDITPFFGSLEEYASQTLYVRFCSETPVSVHLEALVSVVSGPTEVLKIDGVASEVEYVFTQTEFNFGKQLFCETASRTLKLINVRDVPFAFEADTRKTPICACCDDYSPKSGILTVIPRAGFVESYSEVQLSIQFHPGVPGQFEKIFRIQVAHLEPVVFTVRGFGVFPQVYFSLPRSDMISVPPGITYRAVACITPDWFLSGCHPYAGNVQNLAVKPYRSNESNLDVQLEEEEKQLEDSGWDIIKKTESVPSAIDIDLAVERTIAYELASKESESNPLFAMYARSIPQFNVPAYEIDFGISVIGRCVEQSIFVSNFGPLPVIMYVVHDSQPKDGIYVRLKSKTELKIGSFFPFVAGFYPKRSKYLKKHENIVKFFFIEIYHGPKIPLKVTAQVTYPYIIPSMKTLNYSKVVCGCCKIISLRLKNPGFVPAFWTMVFTSRSNDANSKNQKVQDGRSMFFLSCKSGTIDPGGYDVVDISFKPEYEGVFHSTLQIQVAESLDNLKIHLQGEGIEPLLYVSPNTLTFGPALPYSNKLYKFFSVKNHNPFPVEFYFPNFDEQIYEEEKIIRAVLNYYRTKELLLPIRNPGDPLPEELVNFYYMLLDGLNLKLNEQDREKGDTAEEIQGLVLPGEDGIPFEFSHNNFPEKKKKKNKKSFSKSRASMESRRAHSIGNNLREKSLNNNLINKRSAVEVEKLLTDYIADLLKSEPLFDPVYAALQNSMPAPPIEEYRDGILFIFHGAPHTNPTQTANKVAQVAGLQVNNIDDLILQEAALGRCHEALTIKELIEQAYNTYIEPKPKEVLSEVEDEEYDSETVNEALIYEREFEEIQRKYNALVARREEVTSMKAKMPKSSSAKSQDSKKSATPLPKNMNVNSPIADITEEVALDVLKYRLHKEVEKGYVIENLNSQFIYPPPKALLSILKAAGNIKDIIFVILTNNFYSYVNQTIRSTEEDLKEEYLQTLIQILEDQPIEVFEELSVDEEISKRAWETFITRRHESQAITEKLIKNFYLYEKLKRDNRKKGLPVPPLFTIEEDSPKEKKVPTSKSQKTVDLSERKTGSEMKSARSKKQTTTELEFINFDADVAEMLKTVENWDQRTGTVIVQEVVEVKPKKSQTPRPPGVEIAIPSPAKDARGVFVWYIDASKPSNIISSVGCYVKKIYEQWKYNIELQNTPQENPEGTCFSVVTYPSQRKRDPVSDIYSLKLVDPDFLPEVTGEVDDDLPYASGSANLSKHPRPASQGSVKSKKKVAIKRRKSESGTSAELRAARAKRSSSASVLGNSNTKFRWILQPEQTLFFRVRYFPMEAGTTEKTYSIGTVNWHISETVQCIGLSDVPAINMNPEVMFSLKGSSKQSSPSVYAGFFASENIYDFGSIIILPANEEKRVRFKTVNLKLVNCSSLPVDLTTFVDHLQDKETKPITCEPTSIFLQPAEEKFLRVRAAPSKVSTGQAKLFLVIKDNPKVETINLRWAGVKANVVVEPYIINFGRLLLHRKDFRRVTFINDHRSILYINIVNLEEISPRITFSHTSTSIRAFSESVIDVGFSAEEIEQITNQPVQIQVFDTADKSDVVQELFFYVSAEAYDAALDIDFSNPSDDHINFGDIRVESTCVYTFTLKNNGKYPLGFKVEIATQALIDSGDNQLLISPQEGQVIPGKIQALTVSFTAVNEVSWKRKPLLKILLVDLNNLDEVIAFIPVGVSVKSYSARYEIRPVEELNFGHIKLGTPVSASLSIENKGQFAFSYYIEPLVQSKTPELPDNNAKKSARVTASSKDKGSKGKKTPSFTVHAGNFHITPSFGTVEAEQTASITVSCFQSQVNYSEEKILIFVQESLPHMKNGNEIVLKAHGSLPHLNFHDSKSIFREHFIAKSETDFNNVPQLGSYSLFTEDNTTLSFKNICVNKTHEARLHIKNDGLIDCHVSAKIGPGNEEGGNGNFSNFSVFPTKYVIEPYNCAAFVISFKPDSLEEYRASVTITLEMPENFDDVVQKYWLYGCGTLPHVEITEPPNRLTEGQALVSFGSTPVGKLSWAPIAFSNVGIIDCNVIIELYKHQEKVFYLIPKPETKKMLKVWELSKPIDHTVLVSISPGEVAEFNVAFNPKEVKSYSSLLKLFIVDNPFENLSYKLVGEVFFEEVIIEKIRTATPFLDNIEENQNKFSSMSGPGRYSLNFGDCELKKKARALLKLVNKTNKAFFKFEWEEVPNITISPHIGHLYPNSFKEILFSFTPDEPMQVEEAPFTCTINKIVLKKNTETSWDSRLIMHFTKEQTEQKEQQTTETIISSQVTEKKEKRKHRSETVPSPQIEEKKEEIIESPQVPPLTIERACGDEPEHEVVPDTTKSIVVNVSAVADYAKLNCKATKIIFKNTFMFQTRIYPLVLENTGNVGLEYKLKWKSLSAGPIKEHKNTQVSQNSLKSNKELNNRPLTSYLVSSLSSNYTRSSRKSNKRPRPLTGVSLLNTNKQEKLSTVIETCEEPVETPLYNPFEIQNMTGRIAAQEKVSCNIVFSPMDINEYKGVISVHVSNISPECNLPNIEITASSIMPYCHFDIPESDYLRSGRRDYSQPGPIGYAPGLPLDPNTKTIEIKVLGIGQTVPIKFHVINPTDEEYTFAWVNMTQTYPDVVPSFHCSTADGRIQPGRQQLMVFSYVSQRIGITESFWKFKIPKYDVETPFLFVSDVREPSVHCLTTHINLTPTLAGSLSSSSFTIINNESCPAYFQILPDSLYSEGKLNSLKVEPLSGKIPPNSEVKISTLWSNESIAGFLKAENFTGVAQVVTAKIQRPNFIQVSIYTFSVFFIGKTEGKNLFYLKCQVKTLREPFTIVVEAVTYSVEFLLVYEDIHKVKHYANPEGQNILDFGNEMNPNRPETINFTFTSLSRTSLYYEWEYDKKKLELRNCTVKVSNKNGHVTSCSRGKCSLTVTFLKKSSVSNFPMNLKVKRGPTYLFLLNAAVTAPMCDFSFSSYDFGYCYVQAKDICYYEVYLHIKNKFVSDAYLECSLDESSPFSYVLPQTTIHPEEEIKVLIQYHPKECVANEDVLKFTINSLYEKFITLKGHGTEYKVILANPEDTTINLGAVKVGKTAVKRFALLNNGLSSVTVLVGFSDQLPVSGIYLTNQAESEIDLSVEHRLSGTLTITPSTPFIIKPRETYTLVVTYSPKVMVSTFSETVLIQFQEKSEPLCLITGCCVGPQIILDRDYINFGAVLESCLSFAKVKIQNSGSIGAKFEWYIDDPGKEYFISPSSGYCCPETEVTIEVAFKPRAVRNYIQAKAECKFYLSKNETYPSLFLNLRGDCVTLPQPQGTINFKCTVRRSDTQFMDIQNPTGTEWKLIPTLMGNFFKGYDALLIPPMSIEKYKIDYCPLTMTSPGEFHEGTVFFRYPNGQGLLYNLKGTSIPPGPEDSIVREVPCKTKYTELLNVENWLQYPQRFKVNIACVSKEGQKDLVWTCTGFENLEIPASMKKEYSINFFCYNVGTLEFKITFTSEENNEYLWFSVTFNIVMCGPLEVITLKSGVRQTCRHEIKLENPMKIPVKYTLETTASEVRFENTTYEVPPMEKMYVPIFFTPIHAREQTEQLKATSPQLGVFPRELRLISVEIQPDLPRLFETHLGTSLSKEINIPNLAYTTAILQCKTDSEDFNVQETKSVPPGQSTNIRVVYEPSELGSTTATLFINSDQAGNFVFPLQGICVKPLAKGPFTITPGTTISIPFKNPFKSEKEFLMYVDNPTFILKSTEETLQPKQESKINVSLPKFKTLENLSEYKEFGLEQRFPVTGQIVVECFNPYVKWQFYLKGVLESGHK